MPSLILSRFCAKITSLLEQKSQLGNEKRQKDLFSEETRQQMKVNQKLLDLQAEAEIPELGPIKAIEKQEMRLQREAAQGSTRASSIYSSLNISHLMKTKMKKSGIKSRS